MAEARQIYRLKTAVALSEKPACIPQGRPRGAKAAGIRFEKAVFEALSGPAGGLSTPRGDAPSCIRGQWFEFEDENGCGYCQPDIIYPFLPDFFAVIEVKYTLVPGAHQKLTNLYLPVVSKALKSATAGVVIVKNLDPRYRRGKIFTDLRTAAEVSFNRGYPTLVQWAGQALIRSANDMFQIKPSRAA